MTGPPELDVLQLLAAGALVLTSIALVQVFRLGLAIDYTWAAVRSTAQLLLVGYVLRWIFREHAVGWVLAAFAVMLSVATWTAARRTTEAGRRPSGLLLRAGLALAVGSGLTTFAVTAFVVRADPWWEPRYFLPLAGMIVGNAMNAAALAAERLQSEISGRRREIEERLALAATPRQAVRPALRSALRASLIPTVNSMLTVGLVSLPGMMTGQMVAGADPATAARYQIVVMFMLAAATTVAALMLGSLLYSRFFTDAWQLRGELLD